MNSVPSRSASVIMRAQTLRICEELVQSGRLASVRIVIMRAQTLRICEMTFAYSALTSFFRDNAGTLIHAAIWR